MPLDVDEINHSRVSDLRRQSQPLAEFVSTLARYVPYILIGALLTAAAVFVITTPKAPRPVAAAKLGLTEKVVWPFYDTAQQRAITMAQSREFAGALTTDLGDIPLVELAVDDGGTDTFVVLTTTSDTADNAVLAANQAADLLMAQDLERVRASAETDLEAAESLLAESRARVEEIDSQLEEVIAAESDAQATVAANPLSASARQSLLQATTERNGLSQARGEEVRQQVDMTIQRDNAQAALDDLNPELELLDPAKPPPEQPPRSLIPPIAAFIGMLAAGAGLAVLYDRSRGMVSSRWYAEQLAGVEVLGELQPKRWEQSVGLMLSKLLNLSSGGTGRVIAFTGLPGVVTTGWTSLVAYYLTTSGFRVIEVASESSIGAYDAATQIRWNEVKASRNRRETIAGKRQIVIPLTMSLLDTPHMQPVVQDVADSCHLVIINGDQVGTKVFDMTLGLADCAILLTRRGRNRVDELQEAADMVATRRQRLLGTVLVTPQVPESAFVEKYSPRFSGLSGVAAGG